MPEGAQTGRKPDGSWSAWDGSHAVDVKIVEFTQGPDWKGGTPEQVLASLAPLTDDAAVVHLSGAVAQVGTKVQVTDTSNGPQPLEWTQVRAAAVGTFLYVSIVNEGERDAPWHDEVWKSIVHDDPTPPAAPAKGLSRFLGRR